MEQRLMQMEEFRKLYDTSMKKHFPPDELKPFSIMEKAVREGNYFPHGYYEDGECRAYTCLIKNGDFYLLDYFAVMEDGRGKGNEDSVASEYLSACRGKGAWAGMQRAGRLDHRRAEPVSGLGEGSGGGYGAWALLFL